MDEIKYQIINFSALALVLFFALKKTVVQAVAKRHLDIKAMVEDAANQRLEAQKKLGELDLKIKALESDTKIMLSKALVDAQEMKKRIIEDAGVAASKMIKDAQATATVALQDQRGEIKIEVARMAIELAEKLIKDKLSSEDQKRMISEYAGEVHSA